MLIEKKYQGKTKSELLVEIQELKQQLAKNQSAEDYLESYQELFDNSSELIYIISFEGILLDVNKAVVDKYGYDKSELVGVSGEIFSAPGKNDMEKAGKHFQDVITKGKIVKYDWWGIKKDGTIFPKEFVMRKSYYHGEEVVLMTGRDISDRKEYESKIIEREREYKYLFERNLAGIYRTKIDGTIVDCNPAFATILGYTSKNELIGKINAVDLYVNKGYRRKNIQKIVKNHSVKSNRIRLLKKDGSQIWVLISTAAIMDGETDKIKYLEGTFIDITEQVIAEEMLQKSQESYRLLLDTSPFGIVLHDRGKILFTNRKALEMMGVDNMFDMEGVTVFDFIFKEDHAIARERIRQVYAGTDVPFQEYRLKRKDGKEINIETKANLIDFQGNSVLQLSFHDITNVKQLEKEKLRTQLVQEVNKRLTQELDEKTQIQNKLIASEEKLKTSLLEKEVLLKEVHHRVKNNLQVISSIFNLQRNYSSNETVRDILIESQNRIKSMAFIHESLYKTVDFARINFSEYTENLCHNLIKSYNSYGKTAELELKLKEVFLNLDFAIPCGLILNELITNAIKYAFDGRDKGVITVKTGRAKGKVKLIISDNGVGLPKEINFKDSNTLGFQLVNALVDQINAKIKLKVKNGTEYEISFDVKN